ncbi:Pre-mRNA-splicing factor ATP-dependent RNA helicase [Pacmanvirus A23]|uniref:Pre-mRNA-splicing factor ATP-dependent RNA helicase n=1 Tax=Pacmanvirus A23 TaxID=1932881 RepID=UPI000A0953AC|nr:Pre-mRNA-splicing factor ATP-dependent RNA helicase [Pacmanvirus A23]SIP85844.1 Pre-mRNA-splicing factor ATP-dependent RNA helicase [Pacmanvirus A23]
MFALPTLMIKGNLAAPNGDPELQKELSEWVPYEYILDWFKTRMSKTGLENRVLILKSETSSGKSTLIPAELYKAFIMGKGENVAGLICTQPRVLTAVENVNEILKNYSKVLRKGETIGWSTRYNKLRPKSYGLLSATIGTLAQQLRTLTDEELIAKYRIILIDETHERDLETDMTIYMLKNFLLRNANKESCPFVALMSATFDPESFLKYFDLQLLTNYIWCRGATAVITEMWDWNDGRTVNNYTQAAALVAEKIVWDSDDDPSRADILIFMPGKAEFKETFKWLVQLNEKLASQGKNIFSILQIERDAIQSQNIDYKRLSSIPVQEHEVIIKGKKYVPTRRVIISTNVAETGLTLENLKYVIDSGYNREIEFNPVLGIRALITKPAPQSRVRQRRGRVGRKFSGTFYPLYPKYIHEKLPELQFPTILIEDVSPIMVDIIREQLKVKMLSGDRNPEFLLSDIDMIDVPTPDALASVMEKLYSIGFVSPISPKWDVDLENVFKEPNETANDVKFGLTKLGMLATTFNMLSPENARMILAAYSWGCSVFDIITIAAYVRIGPRSFVSAPIVESETAIPPKVTINWTAVYKAGLPGFIASTGLHYKVRLLIADDFINGLILFNAVKYIIRSSEVKNAINSLQEWCHHNHISYREVLNLIRGRDEIIEQMLTSKMELFEQQSEAIINSTADNFMDIISKIKHCIYDGYRCNLLTRVGEKYVTSGGLEVMKPVLFQENEKKLAEQSEYGFIMEAIPTYILYKELSLKYNRKTSMYDVITDCISTLDSFVSFDPEFTN